APRPLPRAVRQVPDPPEKEDEPFTIGNPDDHTGMRVFPPMGTKPIKRGIVVPDDFDLPPGYVRRFQATDDGARQTEFMMVAADGYGLDGRAGKTVRHPTGSCGPAGDGAAGIADPHARRPAAEGPTDHGSGDGAGSPALIRGRLAALGAVGLSAAAFGLYAR